MKILQVKQNRGFTLIEAMVGVSIFTVSLLASMAVLAHSVQDTRFAKDRLVSEYLAQEGIEYIHNMRDTYMLYESSSSDQGWSDFKNHLSNYGCTSSNGCYFDDFSTSAFSNPTYPITNLTMNGCNASSSTSVCPNHQMLYNSSNGAYNYTAGSSSIFARRLIVSIVNSYEIKVTSTVSWVQGSGMQTVTFSENLFSWIER
jgi:Tfp pilus assembly protein PilV